jgi:hypothetical protein
MASRVRWRGKIFDARTAYMLKEAERLSGVRITPSQGSFSRARASAGTHSGPGAADLSVRGYSKTQIDRVTKALRTVGFSAWSRTRADGFAPHIHAIANGCPGLPGIARRQTQSAARGRNGLGSNRPDRQAYLKVKPTTWEKYLVAKKKRMKAKTPLRTKVRGGVILANIQKGKKNSDVKAYQYALRKYLVAHKVNVNAINPGGATGFFGSETEKLTDTANNLIAKISGNPGWAKAPNTKISSSLAKRIGLKYVR